MKKILVSLVMAMVFLTVSSYEVHAQKVTATVSTDTLTNADNASIYFTVPDGFNAAFQAVVTKLSGTAAGTVVLQGTIDGTNYLAVSDTLTMTNVTTNAKLWNVATTTVPYLKYRLYFVTSGTVSAVPKGYFLLRRKL